MTSFRTSGSAIGWRPDATSWIADGIDVPRPAPHENPLPPELTEQQARVQALADRLTDPAVIPTDPLERTAEQHAQWLLGQLLGWHRREDKAMWWEFFRLMELTPEALVDENEPVGLLEPIGPVDDVNRNGRQTWRYTFPPQDLDLGRIGGRLFDPARQQADPDASPFDWGVGDLVAVDLANATVEIKRVVSDPHPRAVVPLPWVPTRDHQARLYELGRWVAENGIDAPGPERAIRDMLLGRAPRAGQAVGAPIAEPGETDLEAARRSALLLDATVLAIQGPPGAGKTYTGARMITTLLAAGRKVGITATSHKVIGNLLDGVLAAADEEVVAVHAIQRGDADVIVVDDRVAHAKSSKDIVDALENGSATLAAGTPWVWAGERMKAAIDVLFVDEAGQMSLANVVGDGPRDRQHRPAR